MFPNLRPVEKQTNAKEKKICSVGFKAANPHNTI